MGHADPHDVPLLQQGLDGLPCRAGMLPVIAFQPGAYCSTHFDGMPLASVVYGLFSARQHPLSQPIRGRSTHLESCRLHGFTPRTSLEHGASHLGFCHKVIRYLMEVSFQH
jgi:hypothetical protein